jgi:hypothetical protein
MTVVTTHFIHNKNVKNFNFSNKATENYHSLNNGAASVRPHFSPHSIQQPSDFSLIMKYLTSVTALYKGQIGWSHQKAL